MSSGSNAANTAISTGRRRAWLVAALLLAGLASGLGWRIATNHPKRFGVVAEGRLYRCGAIDPSELASVVRSKGVRTVLSLLNPDTPESQAEQSAAERLGLRWLNVPLPGDGSSTPEQRDEIRRIILDDSHGPLLVHCAAGTNRTGLACAMYRIHRDGWTVERALDEMRSYGFDDTARHQNLRGALFAEAALAAQQVLLPTPEER